MSEPIHHSIKSEIKNTFSLSLPLIASQLVYSSSGFVSVAMVARLGKDALAANILVSMVWFALSVLFFGILNAISVLVAHQYGARNEKTISQIMGQSYIMGLIICIVMGLVVLSVPYFLRLSEQPVAVLDQAYQYAHSLLWTIPGLIALIVGEQFLMGLGRTKLVLYISLLVIPVEIPLIYLLIFGKLGLPAFGIAGVGYGLGVTFTLSAIGLTLYLLFSRAYRHFHIFYGITRVHARYLKELFVVGLPMGLMHFIEVAAFAVATFWMSRFGTTLLAAHQIVIQFLGFAITIVFAMSQAVTTRVGHEVGRHDRVGIQYAVYVGMAVNFTGMALIGAGFYFFPDFFLQFDVNVHDPKNQALVSDAASLLAIAAVLMIFDNFRIIGFGALRGLKDTHFPMLASLVSFWFIGLTSAYLFAFVLHDNAEGIWWGLTLGIACGAFMIFARLQYLISRVDLHKVLKI